MEDGFPLVIIVIVLGLTAVAMVCSYYAEQKRREALFLLAHKLGLEFSREDMFHIADRYSHLDCLNRGHRRRACNVLHGQYKDFKVTAFDFIYYTTQSTGKGTREQKHVISVVIFDTRAAFKSLFIRPENVLDRVAGAVGFDDIDFESDEFSRAFYVKSNDKKFAYDVIHQRMMEYLLQNRGWSLQLFGISASLFNGRKFSVEEFERGINFLCEFFGLFPEYLWRQLTGKES